MAKWTNLSGPDVNRVCFELESELFSSLLRFRDKQVRAEIKLNSRSGAQKTEQLVRQVVVQVKVNIKKPVEVRCAENTELLPDLFNGRSLGPKNAGAVKNVFDKFECRT